MPSKEACRQKPGIHAYLACRPDYEAFQFKSGLLPEFPVELRHTRTRNTHNGIVSSAFDGFFDVLIVELDRLRNQVSVGFVRLGARGCVVQVLRALRKRAGRSVVLVAPPVVDRLAASALVQSRRRGHRPPLHCSCALPRAPGRHPLRIRRSRTPWPRGLRHGLPLPVSGSATALGSARLVPFRLVVARGGTGPAEGVLDCRDSSPRPGVSNQMAQVQSPAR